MNTHAYYHYHFHPVGQGLFASGCLYQSNMEQPRFLWVYDCGSLSFKSEAKWKPRIEGLKQSAQSKACIDLLTLSHFDKDHITGVTALLNEFAVDTLLLPYVPLWERLGEVFAKNVTLSSEEMRYLIDPVTFLRDLAASRGGIRRTVLVLPSDGEAPAPQEGRPAFPPEDPWTLDGPTQKADAADPLAAEFGNAAGVELLPSGAALKVESLWEFVAYNKPRGDVAEEFKAAVNQMTEALLRGPTEERANVLAALKALYESTVAKTDHNVISLFLYAGPIYPSWKACKLLYGEANMLPSSDYGRLSFQISATNQCSVLYSGDGYLKEVDFDHLKTSFGPNRLSLLGVFQVCHHGSRANWHKGLADKLHPHVSVFSSDPNKGEKHPDAEVLRDFWSYRPVQVNTEGYTLEGLLIFPPPTPSTTSPALAALADPPDAKATPEDLAVEGGDALSGEAYWTPRIIADARESHGPDIL